MRNRFPAMLYMEIFQFFVAETAISFHIFLKGFPQVMAFQIRNNYDL